MRTTAIWLIVSVSLLAGCTSDGTGSAPTPDQTLSGDVQLTATMTIAPGRTVAISAGATVTLANGAGIDVQGTLLVQGMPTSPVKFVGVTHTPGSWGGIVLEAGGRLVANFTEVHDASYAFDARAGSSFQIDHILMDNSIQLLQLATDGTLSHGVLHGGASVLVNNASPTLSDTVLDQGLGSDIVIVSGATSKPVFDHLEVTNAHCAFHFNGGAGVTVSNSFVHDNAYAFMISGSVNTQITHNNFIANGINLGTCNPTATAQVTGNYFGGLPPFNDGTCSSLAATGTTTVPYTAGVGPRP